MRKKLRIYAVLIVLIIVLARLIVCFEATAKSFCKYDTYNALNAELSKKLHTFTLEHRELQRDICEFQSENGTLRRITVNSATVSEVTAQIVEMLTDAIRHFDESGFGIPLGNITGAAIFSGKGPIVKIKTVPLGNIACDTESMFVSAGINQTLFKLVLKISCAYQALAPFATGSGELCFTYTLCETVIIGDVPKLYLNN